MFESVNYDSVEEKLIGGVLHWVVVGTIVDDVRGVLPYYYLFPQETFENRVAEYGFDPSDHPALLDIVLAESFLTEQDFAVKENLADAPSIESAREAHISRCARVKLRTRQSVRGKVGVRGALKTGEENPLSTLVSRSPIDEEVVQLKQEMVKRARQSVPETGRRRGADMRHILGLDREDPSPEPTSQTNKR